MGNEDVRVSTDSHAWYKENRKEIFIEELFGHIEKLLGKTADVAIARELAALWSHGMNRISNDELRMAVKYYYLMGVPVEFYSAPSSVSGNHHPWWHNQTAGMLRHLTECCVMADRLLRCYGFVKGDNDTVDPEARDIVLAATVITDTWKNGMPWGEKTVRNHGELASHSWWYVARTLGFPDDELIGAVAEAVHWHYGRYTPVPFGEKQKELLELPPLVQIVHLLDSCSANRDIPTLYKPVKRIALPESIRP